MRGLSRRAQLLLAAVPVVLLIAAFLIFPGGGSRTVTAHFDRAVAVYPGTDLRVMGVRIGEVTAVVPDGNSVRVEMKYDHQYKLPVGAKAAVVTPTLVSDRYVQVFPAYAQGQPVLKNHADIPLDDTQTPIELDRMFKSLDQLSLTLGPKAGSTSGALNNLLTAGANALDGNGALGSKTIRNLSEAADVFASNRGPLFDNVRSLAQITDTLADNDTTVQTFVKQLTSVSSQFAGERDELKQVLNSLANVLGSVKGFVSDNRKVLGRDVTLLSSLLNRVDKQKDALGLVIQKGPLAMGNLAESFESSTGTFGSRVQITPGIQFRPDQFLCQTLVNDGVPQSVCDLITKLLQPLLPAASGSAAGAATTAPAAPSTGSTTPPTGSDGSSSGPVSGLPALLALLGGGR
jgi:phospholipid/cholesterol/gamma-HCH transport system substrate-binding protein